MLQAIKNKKAGRNFKETEIQWSSLFEGSEDSLTSSVVGTLLYLPHTILWKILNKAVGYNIISIEEPIVDFIFWPSWSSEYTDNKNFVEPDVFIQTPNYQIIIEAKKAKVIQTDVLYTYIKDVRKNAKPLNPNLKTKIIENKQMDRLWQDLQNFYKNSPIELVHSKYNNREGR